MSLCTKATNEQNNEKLVQKTYRKMEVANVERPRNQAGKGAPAPPSQHQQLCKLEYFVGVKSILHFHIA